MSDTLLVTGATGFIGRHIVRRLAKTNVPVRILVRDSKKASLLFPGLSLETRIGDIADPASLIEAMQGVHTVINCVQFRGHPVENKRRGWTYWQVDALGTEAQVKAAKVAGVKYFIYFSGAGTCAPGANEPWFIAKAYAEKAIRESGIPATILRPSWIYGPGDRSMSRFIKMVKWLPVFPMLGDGNNHIQPVHVEDVAELVSLTLPGACPERSRRIRGGQGGAETLPPLNPLLTKEGKIVQTFDVGGTGEMTMNELVRTVRKALGKNRPIIHIPKWLAKLGILPLQLLPNPPMTPRAIDFVTMDVRIDLKPLQQAYPGWKPRRIIDLV